MNEKSYTIWIEAEEWAEDEWNIYDDNTDVAVEFDDKSRWVATFYTYKNIQTLTERNRQTGECLNGKYLWGSDMVLVDECSRNRIEEVIDHLILEKEFESKFDKCDDLIDLGEIITEVKSTDDKHKVIVDKFKNGSFEVNFYNWRAEKRYWKVILTETFFEENNALHFAAKKISECSV